MWVRRLQILRFHLIHRTHPPFCNENICSLRTFGAALLFLFSPPFCGYWLTRKAPLLVLKNTPNAFRVFLKCSNGFHYTPRRFHSGTLWPSILKKLFESYLFFYPLVSPHICFKKVSEKLLVVLQGFYQDSLLSTEGAARLDLLHRRFHSSCLFLKDISFKNFSSL